MYGKIDGNRQRFMLMYGVMGKPSGAMTSLQELRNG